MGPDDSTSSSAGKIKGYSIPQLQADGMNWIMWKQQTLSSLMSNKGVQRHIEGTARTPPAIPMYPTTRTLSDDELEELEKIEEKWDTYNQHETSIKAQRLTTIPESIAIEVQGLTTGKASWDALCNKHEKKALTAIVDLRHRIYVLKCMDEVNVKNHIHLLSMMYVLNNTGRIDERRVG